VLQDHTNVSLSIAGIGSSRYKRAGGTSILTIAQPLREDP